MSVQRFDGNIAFTSAVRLQYTDDLADVFKDYANPDGTAVEFRILVSINVCPSKNQKKKKPNEATRVCPSYKL